MTRAALPDEIEVRELLDGVEWRLPARVDSEPRQLAGKVLLVVGGFDTLMLSSLIALMARRSMPGHVFALALGSVVLSGVFLVLFGLWNLRSRATLGLEREVLRAATRMGPFGWSRRVEAAGVDRLVIERDLVRHVNYPGSKEGEPDVLALRAARADGRPVTLLAGYHRRLVEPLAEELAERLGVEAEHREPAA